MLVTGSSGLLGSKLCELAVETGHQVYSGYFQHEPLAGIAILLDLSDNMALEKAFSTIRPEAVIHCAALTDVDKCELEKELACKINAEATRNVAELCKKHDVFLIYISTDQVFNGQKGMYTERDVPAPINHYGLTKLKGEEFVRNHADRYCIARTSVIYGSVPSTGKVNFALWLFNKLKNKERVKIVTDQWNSPTLNDNLAGMVLEIMTRKLKGIYHLAGATRISRYGFAKLFAQTFALDSDLVIPALSRELSWVAKRPCDSSLNIAKAQRTLKDKPLSLEEALKKMNQEMETVAS